MNFTREPIIETIITPKDGCKLVIRNSKGIGQEEYFVDAVEVVSFGHAFFYRSLERPKCFLVPVSDYEVVEVRETRMVLKSAPIERGIKIGGGRESTSKIAKEPMLERENEEVAAAATEEMTTAVTEVSHKSEIRNDKKRDRRRNRRRRGRDETVRDGSNWNGNEDQTQEQSGEERPGLLSEISEEEKAPSAPERAPPVFTSLLPPPPTLISETISRYRGHPEYKKAFFASNEEGAIDSTEESLPYEETPEETVDFFEEIPTSSFETQEMAAEEDNPFTPTFFREDESELKD